MLRSVRWGWALGAGALAGAVSYLLVYPVIFGYSRLASLSGWAVEPSVQQFASSYAILGGPLVHLLMVLLATFFVVAYGTTGGAAGSWMHGVLVALASVAVLQGIVLYVSPPPNLADTAILLVMALVGGLLGSTMSRSAMHRGGRPGASPEGT